MPFLCVLRLRFGFCVFLYFNHIPIDVLSALSLYTDTSAHARTHRLKVLVGFFFAPRRVFHSHAHITESRLHERKKLTFFTYWLVFRV